MRLSVRATAYSCAFFAALGAPAQGSDLVWEVESPFRFFKDSRAFALHERAYQQAMGKSETPPADVIWRTERRLNDPDCRDASSPDKCFATRRARYEQSRLGWAAQTLPVVCYESNASPRRYPTVCDRRYSWGTAKEDYVLPEAHTVIIGLSPERLKEAGAGECLWSWIPRAGGKAEQRKLACKSTLTIARVPYATERSRSGVEVSVKLPDGREFADANVVVEDVLIVGLGDSFASGESNPDRPVTFSATREMVYDPTMHNEQHDQHAATKHKPTMPGGYGVASIDQGFDPKVLPRRRLEDEEKSLLFRPSSQEFLRAFDRRSAQWLSADCHRSQYGYPFRVGIQLALENRKRAVTLISLACSGSEVTEGLFLDMPAREGKDARVRAQFDQLSDLMCRGGARARSQFQTYELPVYSAGSTSVQMRKIEQRWCPPAQRKRNIDLVLMSIGGNDVGFGALAAYSMTDSAADIAPIAGLIGHQIRYSPDVSRVYLNHLDKRLAAVRAALRDGFGVDPSRVVQNAYEPIHLDERGELCGAQPTLGMDVHPKLRLNKQRLGETAAFFGDFVKRLECTANARKAGCPSNLATGAGTGFTLVTEHQAKFARRGLCARDPRRAIADGLEMAVPRKSRLTDEFAPYSPAAALPYAAKWRLFRTPNDAFMAANTHSASVSPFDIVQPAFAGLYSGAVHPTAEAHAIVADHVIAHARRVVERRPDIEIKPVVTTGQR